VFLAGLLLLVLIPPLTFGQSAAEMPAALPSILEDGHGSSVWAVAYSPDGHLLVSGDGNGTVNIWEVKAGKLLDSLDLQHWVHCLAFTPDGQALAIGTSNMIRLWDVNRVREIRNFTFPMGEKFDHVKSVAFSPDGQLLAAAYGLQIGMWEVATGREVRKLNQKFAVYSIAICPDGLWLASAAQSATRENEVKLWDIATGGELRVLKGHENFVTALAFSPHGDLLASGSTDETRLWDPRSGRMLAKLPHEKSYRDREMGSRANFVNGLAFSPDGQILAEANTDGTINLWEVSTRRLVRALNGQSGPVLSVAFAPTGLGLAAADDDTTVKIWDPTTGKQLATTNRYFYSQHVGIRILYPAGWAKEDEVEASLSQPARVDLRKQETLAHVFLVRETIEISPETYEQLVVGSPPPSTEQYNREARGKVTRDNVDGVRVVSTWSSGGVQYRTWIELFSVDKQHYRIMAMAPAEVFKLYSDMFDAMLKSVRFPHLHIPTAELPADGSPADRQVPPGGPTF
jgi:WD40 repeat protein